MTIFAKVIADSILKLDYDNSPVSRITTMIVTFPRFILAEFNTHRMFSRNSASSRAIPFEKMIKSVEENPFIPIAWQKHHKGMQGTEYFGDETCAKAWGFMDRAWTYAEYENKSAVSQLQKEWLDACDNAVQQANSLSKLGVTKQLCNRLLEPWMWTTVLITGSKEGWDNFFSLRLPEYHLENVPTVNKDLSLNSKTITLVGKSKKELLKQINEIDNDSYKGFKTVINNYSDLDWLRLNKGQSEIHMMTLAEAMWDAYNESTPKELKAGEWHIPFGDDINKSLIFNIYKDGELTIHTKPLAGFSGTHDAVEKWYQEQCVKIATARCARVSYTVVGEENKSHNYENDIKLHDRLVSAGHWSPFEHCARAMTNEEYYSFVKGEIPVQIDKYGITNLEMMPFSSGDPIVGFKGLNPTNGEKYGWCNNFRGFIQYRHLLENEK